jgi:uncharacterized membrane protein
MPDFDGAAIRSGLLGHATWHADRAVIRAWVRRA